MKTHYFFLNILIYNGFHQCRQCVYQDRYIAIIIYCIAFIYTVWVILYYCLFLFLLLFLYNGSIWGLVGSVSSVKVCIPCKLTGLGYTAKSLWLHNHTTHCQTSRYCHVVRMQSYGLQDTSHDMDFNPSSPQSHSTKSGPVNLWSDINMVPQEDLGRCQVGPALLAYI